MEKPNKEKIKELKKYFEKQPQVLLAFVFGSFAKGFVAEESDVDIGLYLKGEKQNEKIESDISRLLEKETDIVYFNEAPASLAAVILQTGLPLAIKDKKLYWDIYLRVTAEAEDFLQFTEDYMRIYQAAKSLIPGERVRLLERIQFLDSEFKELEEFKKLTFEEYQNNKDKRRVVERWAENILNATLDVAKMVLASEKKKMPKNYEGTLYYFANLVGLNEKACGEFSSFANLRNILTHEYLDIVFDRLQKFISQAPPFYEKMFQFLNKYLEKNK